MSSMQIILMQEVREQSISSPASASPHQGAFSCTSQILMKLLNSMSFHIHSPLCTCWRPQPISLLLADIFRINSHTRGNRLTGIWIWLLLPTPPRIQYFLHLADLRFPTFATGLCPELRTAEACALQVDASSSGSSRTSDDRYSKASEF